MKLFFTLFFVMIVLVLLSFQAERKKVLVIGDSISIGYTPFVKAALEGKADVTHNPGNAQHTGTGLKNIDKWLGNIKWDVIHFNWGLWDLAYRNPDSKEQGNRDKVKGKVTHTLQQYTANLDSLVRKLKSTGAKLIFATTTVVPPNEAGRFEGDDKKYNDAALSVMKKYDVEINDLNKYSTDIHKKNAKANGDVHYTEEGYKQLSAYVTQAIEKALGADIDKKNSSLTENATPSKTQDRQNIQWLPNIVLIFADDLGYKDCGFTGSKIFRTPNIDAMASKGMVFSNAYAAAGNCAPSRAALMSGRYSPETGVYAVGSTTRGPIKDMKLVPVKNTEELKPEFVTVAEALKQQGYTTGLFGKWHLGFGDKTKPNAQGFDEYFDSRYPNPNKRRDEPKDPKGIFSLTDAAINFMEKNKQQPFFAFISHHAIHGPQEAKPETLRMFTVMGMDKVKAMYAACTYDLDAGVGKVLKYLDQSGLTKNTLVIFTSDNGATQKSSQEPLRGNKGCYYEGGIREPFIAYWPGKIKAGTLNKTPVINVDLYPTFLAAAGNNKINLSGENLLPVFFGQKTTTARNKIFWHFPGYLDDPVIRGRDEIFRTRPVSVMRKGDWKVHLYHEEWLIDGGMKNIDLNNAVELYYLKTDSGERINLALKNKTKRNEMLNDLLAWLKKENAPMPVKIDKDHKPVKEAAGEE